MKIIGCLLGYLCTILYRKEYFLLKKKINSLLGEYYNEENDYSQFMKSILIIGEDHRYFYHLGVDLIAIVRIIWKRIIYSVKEGGSTIEQQLVRTITNNYKKSISRKFKEIMLACSLHQYISKSDIAGLYLKVAYFGWDIVGLNDACRKLNISKQTKCVEEGAKLISRLKYPQPRYYSEHKLMKINNRINYIVQRFALLSSKFIDERQLV